jgi:hypothetical protein
LVSDAEGKKSMGYRGKSALGPVLAFGFVAFALAVIVSKRSAESTEPETAPPVVQSGKPVEEAFPASAKPFQMLSPDDIFAGASEILLHKESGKVGTGSAKAFTQGELGTGNDTCLRSSRGAFASLKQPPRAGREAHSLLFLKRLEATGFDFGFAWRSATITAPAPRIYYRAIDLKPVTFDMADLPLAAMVFDPNRPASMFFQGMVHP